MAKRRDEAAERLRELQMPLWTDEDLERWAADLETAAQLPHARNSDPATSHTPLDAHRVRSMMLDLLDAYATGPKTADEAARAAGFTADDGAWKRVSDLHALGLIRNTGQTRIGDHGREQQIRVITPAGLLVHERNP